MHDLSMGKWGQSGQVEDGPRLHYMEFGCLCVGHVVDQERALPPCAAAPLLGLLFMILVIII